MNEESKVPPATEFEGESRAMSPEEASLLLRDSTNRARRQFDVWPPYLLYTGAAIFSLAFGYTWWSVHGQHPYVGPSNGALTAMYGGIIVWIVVVSAVLKRANGGVGGRSAHQRRAYRAGFISIIIAYSTFQGALYHAGASRAIVYGIYPSSVPWLFVGTVFVTIGAIREQRPALTLGVVLIALGLASAFAGPVAAWLVTGIALAVAFTGFATVRVFQRRS